MAVAVTAALAAPVAAFAQASNVQIYGTLDMSVEQVWLKGTNDVKVNTALAATPAVGGQGKNDLYSQSSRLGFKGTEDLGNGLKAWFQIENGLNVDGRQNAMTGAWAGRNSALGLEGGFGNVLVGNWDTPYKSVLAGSMGNYGGGWLQHNGMLLGGGADSTGTLPNLGCDNMGASQNSNTLVNATNCGQVEGNQTSFHRRVANIMQYWTPRVGGVQGKFAYVGNSQKTDNQSSLALGNTNSPTLFSMDLNYAAGPLSAGVAYERHAGFRASGLQLANTGAISTNLSISTNNAATDTATQLYGSYDFGVVKIQANWESLQYGDTAIAGVTSSATTGTISQVGAVLGSNNFKRDAWFLGASAPIGNGRVFGGYSTTSGNKSCGTLGVSGQAVANSTPAGGVIAQNFFCGGDTGSTAYTLGYEYSLSKRTSVYTTYMNVDNKQYAAFQPVVAKAGVNGAGLSTGIVGQDMSAINLGMKHSF